MTIRTRIEPSPSGSIHVGNAYAALYNWLLARKQGGAFILRIADTDRARVTDAGIRSALEDLRWLGLDWDEGPEIGGPHEPYFQSERFELYRDATARLIDAGHAYRCYCTPEELEQRRTRALAEGRPPGYDGRCRTLTVDDIRTFEAEGRAPAVRFRLPEGETRLDDLVRGEVVWDHATISDFVIQRADGTPLYMLAVSYDDTMMELTHVIRAEEHLSNTPKQIALIRALGREPPQYGHIPLIVDEKRKKLSKRWGAVSVAAYREMGYLPDVLLNYLAILSWSVGDGVTERFTVPELIDAFDVGGITKSPSAFDLKKLAAFNGMRIRELDPDELASRLEPFMEPVWGGPPTPEQRSLLRALVPLVQERMERLDQTPALLDFFFVEPSLEDSAATLLSKPESAAALQGALEVLSDLEPWTTDAISVALLAWADGAGLSRKKALQPLRAAVSGRLISPPLFESLEVLGRDRSLSRLRAAVAGARA